MRVLLLLFFLVSTIGYTQNDTLVQKDLKIGLVLSGGGAKGFAHVGVLKVLEEAGVRIDYIGGTSMGAIIGALYSTGYSARELDSIVRAHDFETLMQDRLPRDAKSIYQKENTEKYALSLPIINRTVGFPTALSKGQNVFNLLTKLTSNVSQIDDFSKLPIPFFCVATNLETGGQELLESGFLPEAIRASGAFPSLLDPVEIDGKLLTDGAVANNFPVEEMMAKGVDIIIGVDVQDKLSVKEELNSAPKILMQIVSFQMYENLDIKRKVLDVYLHPDISDYSVVSFDKVDEIVEKGVIIAEEQLNYFEELASQQLRNDVVIEQKLSSSNFKNFGTEDFVIKGLENYTQRFVLGKLGVRKEKTITYQDFEKGLDVLAATNGFQSIQYKFLNTGKIELKLKESAVTNYLQIGAHFDDLFKTSALLNVTSKHLLFKNDIFSADLILGDNIRYNIDYFIDNGFHWSYGINTRHDRFEKAVLRGAFSNLEAGEIDIKAATKYNDFTTQLYVQSAFTNTFALRLGAEGKYLRVFTEDITNNETIENFYTNNLYVNAFAAIKIDTYDKNIFPKKGFYLDVSYKGYAFSYDADGSREEEFNPFTQLKGSFGFAHTFGERVTAHLRSEAGVTIGENNDRVLNFHLGGNNENFINNFTSFYGYDVGDLSSEAYLKSALTLRYEFVKKNYLSFTANAARAEEDLINDGAIFENTKTGFGVGYSLESFLGPIEIKYTWTPDTNQNIWFFNIGYWF